jgi:hypothetical protein
MVSNLVLARYSGGSVKVYAVLLLLLSFSLAAAHPSESSVAANSRSFQIYDNMFYREKPDTSREGLIAANILYENKIWPSVEAFGVLPSRNGFQTIVRLHIANPGPLVIDIEKLPLKGSPDVVKHNAEILAKLADWAREAAPGKVIGFYGTNTLSRVPPSSLSEARELAGHVDAFFPPIYTFDDDRSAWEKRAQETVAEAHELGPGKPVYFYLWPQYHDGTPKAFQYVDAAYWKFQLETARRYSDGIVLWSPSRYDWNDATGWWSATQQFAHSLRVPSR